MKAPLAELFAGKETGDDAPRVLGEYLRLYTPIRADVAAEAPQLRSAAAWAKRLK